MTIEKQGGIDMKSWRSLRSSWSGLDTASDCQWFQVLFYCSKSPSGACNGSTSEHRTASARSHAGVFSYSESFDQRRRPETLRTAIAMAFFWPTSVAAWRLDHHTVGRHHRWRSRIPDRR
jgi:hypothetical protein